MKERVVKNDENKRNFKKNEEYTIDKLKKIISNSTNSHRRKFLAHQLRSLTRKEQSKKRRERKKIESDGGKVTRQIPNTIESLRVLDETIVEDADEEVVEAERVDEFSDYMNKKVVPKLLITTSENPSIKLKNFIKELLLTIPSSYYYKRGNFRAKSIMKYAINKEFTDVIIIVEHLKKPYGMYISHLPEGPTSFFRLTSLKLSQEMKGSAALTTHLPEVLLNNFTTRLGRRVAKQLMALFPQVNSSLK
jgi:ribosome production factor 1